MIKGKKDIEELERTLSQLIKEYDMFFKGYERVEPTKKRQLLKRKLNNLLLSRLNNGIVKQKVANLSQKFSMYQRKWDQIWIQIERGTYKIDRYKMKLHQKNKMKSNTSPNNNVKKVETGYDSLLNKYVTTQRLLGVHKNVDYKSLSKKLELQKKKIKDKYKCKDVNFKVIVKEGKATIKPFLIK